MKAKNIIIVTSGRATQAADGRLSRILQLCTQLKRIPVLVLGPDGDDLLSLSLDLEVCDLVFDPNFNSDDPHSFFSSVKAGLHAVQGAAWVFDLGLVDPMHDEGKPEHLHLGTQLQMIETWLTAPAIEADVLQPATHGASEVGVSLITSRGSTRLKNLPSETSWKTPSPIAFQRFEDRFDPHASKEPNSETPTEVNSHSSAS